jgi:peptidoglycan-associated lipoprotein
MRFLTLLILTVACHKRPPELEVVPTPPEPLPMPMLPSPIVPASEVVTPMPSALESIYFDFDESALRPDALDTLSRDLTTLQRFGDARIEIQGHCDERGTNDYNLALGERRAMAAQRWLTAHGVAETRIRTVSFGEERPIDRGHDEEAWWKNRRDEFYLSRAPSMADR